MIHAKKMKNSNMARRNDPLSLNMFHSGVCVDGLVQAGPGSALPEQWRGDLNVYICAQWIIRCCCETGSKVPSRRQNLGTAMPVNRKPREGGAGYRPRHEPGCHSAQLSCAL